MDTVLKTVFVFAFIWLVIRISGRRTMGEMGAFDFVLMLLIGGAIQRALTGQDYSLANAILIVFTLVLLDIVMSLLTRESAMLSRIFKGVATIVVEHGRPLQRRLRWARITESDVLEAARRHHGLERMDQIKFAILESSGHISIVPYDRPQPGADTETTPANTGRTDTGRAETKSA